MMLFVEETICRVAKVRLGHIYLSRSTFKSTHPDNDEIG